MLCGVEGKSKFAVYFWLILLIAVVHIGLLLVPVYLDQWRMEDEINAKAGMVQALRSDDHILKFELAKYAQGIGLPIKEENIVVLRDEEQRKIRISTAWDVELRFFWGLCGESCIRKYHFEPRAEAKY